MPYIIVSLYFLHSLHANCYLIYLKLSRPGYFLQIIANYLNIIYLHTKNCSSFGLFWNPEKWGHCLSTWQTTVGSCRSHSSRSLLMGNVPNGKHDASLYREVKTVNSWLECTSHSWTCPWCQRLGQPPSTAACSRPFCPCFFPCLSPPRSLSGHCWEPTLAHTCVSFAPYFPDSGEQVPLLELCC